MVNKVYYSKSIEDTNKFALALASELKPTDIICLEGDLGVGKTVIAKALGKFFNVNSEITSPTFTILKSYKTSYSIIKLIHHFDLYRIKNESELENLGLDDYFYDNNAISIIEWPKIAYKYLPKNIIKLIITKDSDSEFSRKIETFYEK